MAKRVKEQVKVEPIIEVYPVAPEPGVYTRGDVTHPQHKRMRLGKTWHRVLQAQFVDVASAPVSSWSGGGAD